MSLEHLLIPANGDPIPPAWKQNAVLDALLRTRLLGVVENFAAPRAFPHPWRVSVRRFEPPENSSFQIQNSKLTAEATWAVYVAAGVVNDILPTMLYLRQSDPRGWVLPKDYAEPGTDPRWIERDALDDPDDPPFLVVTDPPIPDLPSSISDFTRITDDQRPGIEQGAFCGADTWELELWRAHVIVTAAPFRVNAFAAELPPPRLTKYRFATTPRLPAPTYGASAGGWVELATLYLLRDPGDSASQPSTLNSQLLVRQREWWPLWAVIAQPGGALVGLLDTLAEGLPIPGAFTDLLRDQLEDTLQGAATAEFWTV